MGGWNRWPFAWWRKTPGLRLTLNEGKPMRLIDPFTRIAVHDGAIQLWSDHGAVLMVPHDAGAYLSRIVADAEQDRGLNARG
jgi:hypothetical protein